VSLVEGLYRKYSDFTVNIPHWEISDHGITSLWGPSGSGKTSVLRLLIGIEPCPSLKWEFQGENLAALSPKERRIGVVFQNYQLFPHMTAKENIFFPAIARHIPAKQASQTFDQMTELLQLKECIHRRASLLSGGEQQRVALARALMGQPRILMLDEPFSALDTKLRIDARELVKKVISSWQIPTLLITHDEQDLDILADNITHLENGQIT